VNSTSITLSRLRVLFVAYFLLRTIAGIVLTWPLFGSVVSVDDVGRGRHLDVSLGPYMTFGFVVEIALFALGLWVFTELLHRKCWARLLLLIVGWLSALGALFGLLTSPSIASLNGWLTDFLPGIEWNRVMEVGQIQNLLGLLFWGYLVYVLMRQRVKSEFLPARTNSQ
jgi:hypothetical protein